MIARVGPWFKADGTCLTLNHKTFMYSYHFCWSGGSGIQNWREEGTSIKVTSLSSSSDKLLSSTRLLLRGWKSSLSWDPFSSELLFCRRSNAALAKFGRTGGTRVDCVNVIDLLSLGADASERLLTASGCSSTSPAGPPNSSLRSCSSSQPPEVAEPCTAMGTGFMHTQQRSAKNLASRDYNFVHTSYVRTCN